MIAPGVRQSTVSAPIPGAVARRRTRPIPRVSGSSTIIGMWS